MADDVRTRILGATVDCLGRFGIAKTTVDDAAKAAGVSRATVYRYFPDGKDELLAAAIEAAVAGFFTELAVAVDDAPDLATLLERAIRVSHRMVEEHAVLQKVAETEPERLMPQLSQSAPLVKEAIGAYFAEKLAGVALRDGLTVAEAADWLARMGLSFVFGGGRWDLDDPVAVARLVREELLVAILAEPPGPAEPPDR